jgi:hypothetical protein
MIATHQFVVFFGSEGFMRVEARLKFDVNVTRRMVNKQTTTTVHFTVTRLSTGGEETTLGATDKVINRNLLTWMQVVLLQGTGTVLHDGRRLARSRTTILLSVQAGSTLGWGLDLTSSSMQATGCLTVSQYTTA